MYKTLTSSEYKSFFNFPETYSVDAILCYGGWDKTKHINLFKKTLEESGKAYTIENLPNFLEKMLEVNIEGKRIWFDVSYGGALLSEYLHLACLFGSKKNMLLGSCGGLSPEVEALDLIVPTSSWGNESTTRMYNPEASDHIHTSSVELTQSLKGKIDGKYKVWEGKTMTCQAILAETVEDIHIWSKEGYLGVEMEAATIFAVSKHFNVPSAVLLIVGDNLIQGEAITTEGYKNKENVREEVITEQYKAALRELLS